MTEHPKVFISYSHDSPEHKRWVSELATQLRHNGIDAILDQWDLRPGGDLTKFMEAGIRDADRVLVICTDSYVRKANENEGGVGFERLIVTAQLVQDLGTDKFIPIIRQTSGGEKAPTFLGTRHYIDFTVDEQFDEKINELIHELHRVPIAKKPPLGKNPFAQLPSGQEAPPLAGAEIPLVAIQKDVESADKAYSTAVEIIRASDMLGWRQLLKRVKPDTFSTLVQWQQSELDGKLPDNERAQVVDKAVDIISPLVAMALAGVESGKGQFKNQKSIINDLINITEWKRDGYVVWVEIPYALGYVYHSLHGALCLSTNQVGSALEMARINVSAPYQHEEYSKVWEKHELMGWSDSLGRNCINNWNYLTSAFTRWEWLSSVFTDEQEYRSSLVAYYMALNIHELADTIASNQHTKLDSRDLLLNVPLSFVFEDKVITQHAISLLLRNKELIKELWSCLSVTQEQMENSWSGWMTQCNKWVANVGRGIGFPSLPHKDFFKLLRH